MSSEKRRRGSYKNEFIKNFENAIVDPGTIRRWKKMAIEGENFTIFFFFIHLQFIFASEFFKINICFSMKEKTIVNILILFWNHVVMMKIK